MKIYKVEVYICDLNDDEMSTAEELEILLGNHKYLDGEVGDVKTVDITEEEFYSGIGRSCNDTLEEFRKLFKE